jgi:hypothetical protein
LKGGIPWVWRVHCRRWQQGRVCIFSPAGQIFGLKVTTRKAYVISVTILVIFVLFFKENFIWSARISRDIQKLMRLCYPTSRFCAMAF